MDDFRFVVRLHRRSVDLGGESIIRWMARIGSLYAAGPTPQAAVFNLIREYVARRG